MGIDDDPPPKLGKSHSNLVYKVSKDDAIKDKKCVAFEGAIVKLIRLAVGKNCNLCNEPINITIKMYASCMMVRWRCSYGEEHISGVWSSQPNLFGNLLLPVCPALVGNSYLKTALFDKFFKLGFVGEANYYRYIHPSEIHNPGEICERGCGRVLERSWPVTVGTIHPVIVYIHLHGCRYKEDRGTSNC